MKLPAVTMYVFAGGFTCGVDSTYFTTTHHLADSDYGFDTFKNNFPECDCRGSRKDWGIVTLRPFPELLYANPPCAPWSNIGASVSKGYHNWRTDPRVDCFRDVVTTAMLLRPKVVAIESVPQLLTRGQEFAYTVAQTFLDAGYSVTFYLHDAKFLGIPQQRRRVLLIASRYALEVPNYPIPSGGDLIPAGMVIRTVELTPEERADVALSQPEIACWERVEPGKRFRDGFLPDTEAMRPRFIDHKIVPERPVGTIAARSMLHWAEPRYLATREIAALAGFPPTWKWPRTVPAYEMILQVARGLSPVVGRHLAAIANRTIILERPAEPRAWILNRFGHQRNILCNTYPTEPPRDITEEVRACAS